MRAEEVDNKADIIDGRDIEARMDSLQSERDSITESLEEAKEALREETNKLREVGHEPDLTELQEAIADWEKSLAEWDASDEAKELKTLTDLWQNIGRDSTLVRESYFTQYARQEAESMHDRNAFTRWPFTCIDWEEAAHELQQDYSSLDFDGVTYYTRD